MWCDLFMNGWIGRELPWLCRDAGFFEVQVLPRTAFSPRQMLVEWIAGLEESDRNGRFFCFLATFLASCRKASGSLDGL